MGFLEVNGMYMYSVHLHLRHNNHCLLICDLLHHQYFLITQFITRIISLVKMSEKCEVLKDVVVYH